MSQNPPVEPQLYEPSNFTISNIQVSGQQTLVTTSTNHNYVVGQQVRFHIPIPYGMRQINEQAGYVTVVNSPTSFTVNIISTFYDSYISSPTYPGNTPPQVSAIGDDNLYSIGTTIAGAFQQITQG